MLESLLIQKQAPELNTNIPSMTVCNFNLQQPSMHDR